MDNHRSIGLIGGLGPGATVHYYKKLTTAYFRFYTSKRDVVLPNKAVILSEAPRRSVA
jgi:aspartate/glutamate racemase